MSDNATQWRMVPVEPTPEMVEAAVLSGAFEMPDVWYRAMLAAAPTPPATSEGQEVELPQNMRELVEAAKALLDFIGPKDMRVYADDRPVRDLAAALARAGGDGWRPIAEALEVGGDGTQLWGWDKTNGFYAFEFDYIDDRKRARWMNADHRRVNPTHFRLLPAAPDAEGRHE